MPRSLQAGLLTLIVAGLALSLSPQRSRPAEAAGVALVELADGLEQPLGITHAGDGSGRLFVVEQVGTIRIYTGGALLDDPFLDVSALITTPAASEQGLLGLAFHPDYDSNGYFYINYTDADGDTMIARYSVSADPDLADPDSGLPILTIEQPAANHNGGQLQFGPDGYLYVGMGDGGGAGDPEENAEDVDTLLGKLLRIDVDSATPYAVPPDNPLVGAPGLDEIWAYGLRNPWRFSFDRLNGDLFIADVGQWTYEEVNLQPAGDTQLHNYGWDIMEGAHCFEPASGCNTSGKVLPILEYDHGLGCSITGGYRYRGGDPTLYGKYIYGDFCSGRIWSANENSGSWASTLELDTGVMISSFGEDDAGELYVADYGGGRLYGITGGAPAQDTDGDGCSDDAESGPNPSTGGDRDPEDPWDFYDVTGDSRIDFSDTLLILSHFGTGTGDPGYDPLLDRSAPDEGKLWRTASSADGIDFTDALVNLGSFGHDCA
jgi:hypothetical protein